MSNFQSFETREAATAAAAELIADAIQQTLTKDATATLALSGGTTPQACYSRLAATDLPWHQVTVYPTDERNVPPTHADSNERMLRETLATGFAQNVHIAGLRDSRLSAVSQPFACTLLGMGEDGHFASIFPDADNCAAALDPNTAADVLPITTAASPHTRTTMTLRRLNNTEHLLLLAFGTVKRAVIERPDELPIATLLAQHKPPLTLLWAP